MTDKPQALNINIVQLVNLSCNLLHQAFIKQPRDKAKKLVKDLKGGKRINMGSLTIGEKIETPLFLELDYSEFRGGFNFPAFEAAVKAMLQRISVQLKQKKDLNVLTNQEQGSALVHLPGVIQSPDGRYNVLVMSFEMGKPKEIGIRVMFVDPDQYDALKPEAEEVSADDDDADNE